MQLTGKRVVSLLPSTEKRLTGAYLKISVAISHLFGMPNITADTNGTKEQTASRNEFL